MKTKTIGIFFLLEGLPPTIIESQVLTHVRLMNENSIKMEVWAFAVTSESYKKSLDALPSLQRNNQSICIRLFRGVKPALPFSEWLNGVLFSIRMLRLRIKPSFVHARTEHAAMIAATAKIGRNFTLIWDARGDTLSEFTEFISTLPLIHRLYAPFKVKRIAKRLDVAEKNCDYAIFVSDALRKLRGSSIPIDRTLVVPCVADESLFFYDKKLRDDARQSLGFDEDDIVIVYVGSTVVWQCIPETISLIERSLNSSPRFKALIITPSPQEFLDKFSKDVSRRVRVKSCSLHEINYHLNASDYGVLLRFPSPINKVASPVKFAEYSMAGLIVVATEAVEQVVDFGTKIGNLISVDNFLTDHVAKSYIELDRQAIASRAKEICGSKVHRKSVLSFYKKSIEAFKNDSH